MDKIVCVGELVIDFICTDIDMGLVNGENFIKKAGGAPANVCAAISKLGGNASFVGKVGKDSFGIFLKETLENQKVCTDMLILDTKENTTLAFVSIANNGERDFIFNRGADEKLKYEELNIEKIKEAKIIHLGSATALLGGELKETYKKVLELAKNENKIITFDPNYRIDLWKGKVEEFIKESKKYIKESDIVKVSDEEILLITGKENVKEGVKELHKIGAQVVLVTLGKEGTLLSIDDKQEIINSIKIEPIDTTGAGDAFIGGVLYKIIKENLTKVDIKNMEKMKEIINFGNKVGARTCEKYGAISALPTLDEIE
ncbi:fructokinase [Hypnocyclicus thermotrophus]|uniref:Fructokinase n=1 Tax=Hypnocyclicus thermotrophus TaxID=1627895 RepID=A0AA46E0N1_9FUSO|nr:carbohydrate kinase [Hypnocyclicus thermotrophus]TDT72576.1 fructokinase [Hypnocyclicus thermotrophus]